MSRGLKNGQRALKKIDMVRAELGALKEIRSPEYMRKLGEFVAKKIKTRTRLGFGVNHHRSVKVELKELSEKYIAERSDMNADADTSIITKRVEQEAADRASGRKKIRVAKGRITRQATAKAGGLSAATTPSKSNLTRTGQLLNSIKVKAVTKTTATVGPSGSRIKRADEPNPPTNEQLAEYVSKQGRPFMNLSELEIKSITDRIRLDIKKSIRRALGK